MPERVSIKDPGRLRNDTRTYGFGECVDELVVWDAADAREELQIESGSDRRRRTQRFIASLTQTSETPSDHFADAFGKPDLINREVGRPTSTFLIQGARLHEVADDFANEERITLRFDVQSVCQRTRLRVQLVTSPSLEEHGDFVLARTAEL